MQLAYRMAIARGEIGFDPAALGIRWRPDPPGTDTLEFPSEILRRGYADCEGLTLALALLIGPSFLAEFAPGYGAHVRLVDRDPSIECLRAEQLRSTPWLSGNR